MTTENSRWTKGSLRCGKYWELWQARNDALTAYQKQQSHAALLQHTHICKQCRAWFEEARLLAEKQEDRVKGEIA